MSYSSIKQKVSTCIDCLEAGDNSEKPIIAGRCDFHYKKHRIQVCAAKKKTISKTKPKKGVTMTDWFNSRRLEMTGLCCSCGSVSPKNSDVYFRFGIAHIFPKAIFDSIKTHPDNWLELCNKCHVLMDRSTESASKMKCFKEAVDKFQRFRGEILENHKFLNLFVDQAEKMGFL